MSPESGSTPTEKPLNTDLHPEGVRPFKEGELADVHDRLDRHEDVSAIDPITRNTQFDKIPLETTAPTVAEAPLETPELQYEETPQPEKKSSKGKWIAGLVGSVILGATGFGVHKAMDSEKPEQTTTSVSPNPEGEVPQAPEGEAPQEPTQEEAGIGVEGTTLDTLNVRPTPELWQEALKPVTVAEYPTPEAALKQFDNLFNVRALGGELIAPNAERLSPESEERQSQLDKIIFESGTPPSYESTDAKNNENALTILIAGEIDLIKAIGSNGIPTYRTTITPDGFQETEPGTFTSTITEKLETNISRLDVSAYNRLTDLNNDGTDTIKQGSGEVTLVQKDGQWFVDHINVSY